MKISVPRELQRGVLEYGPTFVGAGLWAFAMFPQQLSWVREIYGRSFGSIAALYDRWTEVEGYGEALDEALWEIREIPSNILDLATGTGFAARRLKRLYPSAEVTGVDISPEMVAVAQHDAVADGVSVDFQVADISDLPFEDETFDLVVLQNSLPQSDEMMRVLTKDGKALVIVSLGGPWVALAWPALAMRFTDAGATQAWGKRAGLGFFGVVTKD